MPYLSLRDNMSLVVRGLTNSARCVLEFHYCPIVRWWISIYMTAPNPSILRTHITHSLIHRISLFTSRFRGIASDHHLISHHHSQSPAARPAHSTNPTRDGPQDTTRPGTYPPETDPAGSRSAPHESQHGSTLQQQKMAPNRSESEANFWCFKFEAW